MPIDSNIPVEVVQTIRDGGDDIEVDSTSYEPLYKVLGEKIPVSKYTGVLWKNRKDAGAKARSPAEDAWREAIRYYENDQMQHRQAGQTGGSGNFSAGRRIHDNWVETENIVFSNTAAMLPMLYSKNPDVVITALESEESAFCNMCQKFLSAIFSKDNSPGVALKAKVRRTILTTLLTNKGWIKVDYIRKEEGADTAFQTIKDLGPDRDKINEKAKFLQARMKEKISYYGGDMQKFFADGGQIS